MSIFNTPGVYRITNTVTSQTYIGSSKNIQRRLQQHKSKSTWRTKSNQMYKDMQTYGLDKFKFEVVYQCCPKLLKVFEQLTIAKEKPFYNRCYAFGRDKEKIKEAERKTGETFRKRHKEELKLKRNRMCFYNNKFCTFNALRVWFIRHGVEKPYYEAKKYIIGE